MEQRRFGRRLVLVSVLAATGALAASGTALAQQEHVGQYSQADINFGMSLYGDNCVSCHGPGGDGVDGVNLRSGQFRAASSDYELEQIISNGIPDTAMLPGNYNEAELAGLVAYLRMMGSLDVSDATIGPNCRWSACIPMPCPGRYSFTMHCTGSAPPKCGRSRSAMCCAHRGKAGAGSREPPPL